eukprot:g19337.t1
MAAPAPSSAPCTVEEQHITISPATSNKSVEFTCDFDKVFRASTLQAAFEQHPVFATVFKSDQETHSSSSSNDANNKHPGQIAALSTETSAATAADGGLSRVSKGLISTIMTAYNTHCDLVIRPDDVWLTILAQFCSYVNKNAEGLRNKIVEHEGKDELKVYSAGGMRTADTAEYQRMIRELLGQIRQNIKSPELADWFRPGFSTTTEKDEVCAAATAMATLQAYFEFQMSFRCGIPSVTLMGTVGDWKLLREKIERLLEFEVDGNPEGKVMEIWVGYLRKVCDGFVESAEHPGSPETLEFWDKVLCVPRRSGDSSITGWVSAFTCFGKEGSFLGKIDTPTRPVTSFNPLQYKREFPLIPDSQICHNVVSCPVKIDDNGTEYDGTLFSGQIACEAERAAGKSHPTVRPRNDWCLAVAMQ